MPWGSTSTFGTDIACAYDPQRFENMFDDLQAYGVNAVRFWLHIDGRCSPVFDADGDVTGVPPHFWEDLDDFLRRARAHDVAVLLTLWAPDMDNTGAAWEQVRPHRTSLITDPSKTRTYIDRVLVPMAERYRHEPALLGYEVMNEPEFAVDSPDVWGAGSHGPADRDTVPLQTLQRFVAQQVVALHRHTRQDVVAAGSAAYKWLAASGIDATVGNWWSDAALRAVTPPHDRRWAYSDFYEVHWYDWEKGTGYSFSPWDGRGPGAYNSDGKPVVIGELPAADDAYYTRRAKVDDSYALGYAGVLFWSYNAIDGFGGWDDIKDDLKAFRDAHPAEVDLDLNRPHGHAAAGG
ncbi:cellulase family glycosylhydrolase [Streptacidiphilus sp. ASG 303]|nr:cellulase family glycosylhydrolase [Streptacidiphilus sp. ASG 303]